MPSLIYMYHELRLLLFRKLAAQKSSSNKPPKNEITSQETLRPPKYPRSQIKETEAATTITVNVPQQVIWELSTFNVREHNY